MTRSFVITLSIVFATTKLWALPDSQVLSEVKKVMNGEKLCSNGENFWQLRVTEVPRRTHQRPKYRSRVKSLVETYQYPTNVKVDKKWVQEFLTPAHMKLFVSNQSLVSLPIEDSETYNLRYSRFGCLNDIRDKGAVVIAPGRSEGSVEYIETAIDFINRGYSPVYVVDHRGQGLSPRLNPDDLMVGHVENFRHYVNDFAFFTVDVSSDLARIDEINKTKTPLFATSNSMGGAIILGYLMSAKKNDWHVPYQASALLGAMIKFNNLSFLDKLPTRFNRSLYSERGAIAQSLLNCDVLKRCAHFAREKQFGPYIPGKRDQFWEQTWLNDNPEKLMTHSKVRWDMRTYLWDEFDWTPVIESHYSNEDWQGPQVGGASFNWVLASTEYLKQFLRGEIGLKNYPKHPLLMITGTRDLRAYTPRFKGWSNKEVTTTLEAHEKLAHSLNHTTVKKFGQVLVDFRPLEAHWQGEVDGAFHEIYKEAPEFRVKAMDQVDVHFQHYSPQREKRLSELAP